MDTILSNWSISCIDHRDLFKDNYYMECEWKEITVPNNVQESYIYMQDIFFSKNIEKLRWTEKQVWVYKTELNISQTIGKSYLLEFKGLDYNCDVYFDKNKIFTHEGMFSPIRFDITPFLSGQKHEIFVVFFLTPDMLDSKQRHNFLKCQNSYKWDAAPRLLTMGIWDEVILSEKNELFIEDVFIKTYVKDANKARIHIQINTNLIPKKCNLQLVFNNVTYSVPMSENKIFSYEFEVENIKYWNPIGYGEPNLYNISVTLFDGSGQVIDNKSVRIGIREISEKHVNGQSKVSKPLQLCVNGSDIYIKGINIVPLDILPARLNKEWYEKLVIMAVNANVNLIRVWGGGLVEKEAFYDVCDEYGIMVWQEFPMACQNPPDTEVFIYLLENEATAIVKKLRNHPSIILWCGGNELYVDWSKLKEGGEEKKALTEEIKSLIVPFDDKSFYAGAHRYNEPSLRILKNICNEYDGTRPYHISSPLEGEGEVHGPWGYDLTKGDHRYRRYQNFYQFWNTYDANLYSEAGCSAITNMETYRSIINENQQWPIVNTHSDLVFHNGFNAAWNSVDVWMDTYSTQRLFGDIDNLEDYIWANQYIQAEGTRYLIEEVRRKKATNCGVILWAFNETWPNAASLSIVDYYFRPKMSYYFMKMAFEDVHISLRYSDCVFDNVLSCEVWIDNNSYISYEGCEVHCNLLDDKAAFIEKKSIKNIDVLKKDAFSIHNIMVQNRDSSLIIVEISLKYNNKSISENKYVFGNGKMNNPLKSLLTRKEQINKLLE